MGFRSLCHHHVAASGSQWKKDFNKHRTWVIAVLWALKYRRVEQSAEKKSNYGIQFFSLSVILLLIFPHGSAELTEWNLLLCVSHVRLHAEPVLSSEKTGEAVVPPWLAAAVTCSHTLSLAHQVLKHTNICWNFKQTKQLLNVMNLKVHSPTSWEFKHACDSTNLLKYFYFFDIQNK